MIRPIKRNGNRHGDRARRSIGYGLAWTALCVMGISETAHALPLSDVARVAVGYNHTCAVTNAGNVKCWGINFYGQLGNGTTADAATPTDVSGLTGNVLAVSTGSDHTCAIVTGGAVKCWGRNAFGQLGDGTYVPSLVPVSVAGLGSGVIAISASNSSTCALTSSGAVKCWGLNSSGQLGNGGTADANVPTAVSGLGSGVSAISAMAFHACALVGGGVKCWGSNASGELGDGTIADALTPIDVSGLSSGITAIAAGGAHSCALTSGGGVKCWGANASGQLGNGTTGNAYVPADVAGLASSVAAIATGYYHTCALMTGGAAKCWGLNDLGQLGLGSTTNASTPQDLTALASGVTAIAASLYSSCAVVGGGVRCWGSNQYTLLGNGLLPVVSALEPSHVVGVSSEVQSVVTGGLHSCALTSGGAVRCWGRNDEGQLGNGTNADAFAPTQVIGLASGVIAISAGWSHSCALTAVGVVKCWGYIVGTATTASTPFDVSGLGAGVRALASGGFHTCALTNAGGVKCWGINFNGQLGDGTFDISTAPVDVVGLASGVVAIAAGAEHSCAITSTGGLKCWGNNGTGQLGNGMTGSIPTPVDVSGLGSGVIGIAAGDFHTCALTSGGGLKCWGNNDAGQLGDGTLAGSLIPIDVVGVASGATDVSAGKSRTCALIAGRAKCWGLNDRGQLGTGTTDTALTPTDVVGLAAGAERISAGGVHTCATVNGGGIACWGANDFGQIGNGAPFVFPTPIVVLVTACADFLDVAPTSAFCRNVEWLRNRAVTLGCALLNSYCPNELVNRLAMAAFMNRLGTALTGKVLWQEAAQGALDLDTDTVVCQTTEEPGVNHTRRAHVAGVFSGTAASTTGFGTALVASIDHGVTWLTLRPRTTRATAPANRWANARDSGQFDLEAGDAVRFGIRVSRDGLPGGADLTAGRCLLRALIGNRQSPISPFDPQ